MDPAQFLTAPRVTIVAGKGGVGKTTVAITLGVAASRVGLSALIVEVEEASPVGQIFGAAALGYEPTELIAADPATGRGSLHARALTPDDALIEYLRDHGLKRISNRLVSSGAIDMIATATPGIKDVLILGKVKQLHKVGDYDVIILDAPAAGHAIAFLRSATGLLDAVRVGPIESQAREVIDFLSDPERCAVMLVTLPEETPVNELVETAFSLEDLVGVALAPVVVNGCYPDDRGLDLDPEVAAHDSGTSLRPGEAEALRIASDFVRERAELQEVQFRRLDHELPLPQIRLPFCFTADLGRDDIEALVDSLIAQILDLPDPADDGS